LTASPSIFLFQRRPLREGAEARIREEQPIGIDDVDVAALSEVRRMRVDLLLERFLVDEDEERADDIPSVALLQHRSGEHHHALSGVFGIEKVRPGHLPLEGLL